MLREEEEEEEEEHSLVLAKVASVLFRFGLSCRGTTAVRTGTCTTVLLCVLLLQDLLQSCSGTREEPGTLTQGAPVFPGSSRLGIEPTTPGWLVQDPSTSYDMCPPPHMTYDMCPPPVVIHAGVDY